MRRAYTIDQTVLIVAVISILASLIIVTLGWTLLSRTGGNKLGAYIEQLPRAVNTYRSTKGTFPGSQGNSVMVDLENEGLIRFRRDNSSPPNYYHDIGPSGGTVSMSAVTLTAQDAATLGMGAGAGSYWIVEFDLVPAKESNEASTAMNGDSAFLGRLRILPTNSQCTVTNIKTLSQTEAQSESTLCYIGDKIT